MNNSKTFCPLPWVHQATLTDGDMLLCCVAKPFSDNNLNQSTLQDAFQSKDWNSVRKKMINGEKPSACERCWVEESNGYRSHRITELDVWRRRIGDEKLNQLVQATGVDGSYVGVPVSLDLRIGNTCNLMCVMCRPQESIKWLGLSQNIHKNTNNTELKLDMNYKKSIQQDRYTWQESEKTWEELKRLAPTLRELIIGGGEPMLLRGQFEFVDYCVKNGYAKNIHLRYHTNLTVLNADYFDLWKEFEVVEFFASIDGFGEQNHYVRYPARWEDIEKNLRLLDELPYDNMLVMILFSAHFLSLYNLDRLCRWIQDQNFRKVTKGFNGYLHPAIVMEPSYLSPQVYPQEIKKEITAKLLAFEKQSKKPSNKLSGVIQYMNAQDCSHRLPTVMEYIYRLDQSRNTSFSNTFPELASQLKDYGISNTTISP